MADHPAACSNHCCGNPRKHYKGRKGRLRKKIWESELTMQEIKQSLPETIERGWTRKRRTGTKRDYKVRCRWCGYLFCIEKRIIGKHYSHRENWPDRKECPNCRKEKGITRSLIGWC